MQTPHLEILAYEDTALGPLCLRRRRTASEPHQLVTEITLNHQFLMSSLHTDSERMLARLALQRLEPLQHQRLRVRIGGLGLGYTAAACLECPRVAAVEVVELLEPVIDWTRQGLTPLADHLNADRRLTIRRGDIYALLTGPARGQRFDAILIDVDHSPEDLLSDANAGFYTPAGLAAAAEHLQPGGALALWSYAEHSPLLQRLQATPLLDDVAAQPVTYFNRHVHEEFTDWLYVATRKG